MRPSMADPAYAAAHARALQRVQNIRGFYGGLIAYVLVISFLWFINLVYASKVIWAHWPMLGWGVGVLVHGLTVFSDNSFFGARWEERKVEEFMARENLRRVSAEKGEVQAQMRLLQAQIEPHFLFNTLATIQSLITRAPDDASRMMDSFIGYLRQSLLRSRAESATLAQEFALLTQYLDLLKIRMGTRLQYSVELDADTEQLKIAPMLLQPIVENAVTHGLEPKVDGGRISLRAAREGGELVIVVEDNGLGFGNAPDSKGTGLGLRNIQERLSVLYDGRASMRIIDAAPGTRVQLRLPIEGNA
jgi:sensor histidine kinase YesM